MNHVIKEPWPLPSSVFAFDFHASNSALQELVLSPSKTFSIEINPRDNSDLGYWYLYQLPFSKYLIDVGLVPLGKPQK